MTSNTPSNISSTASSPEFTAVILAASTGARLFPLTNESTTPKHLLPIAGIPCLVRLLHAVAASGFSSCTVALAKNDVTSESLLKNHDLQKVHNNNNNKMNVSIHILTEDCSGSAEALRQVHQSIPSISNIVVLPGDLVVMEPSVLQQLVNAHRQANLPPNPTSTACTMLLADVGEVDEHGVPLKESNKQKKGGLAREEEDIEYIALSEKERVVWKQSKLDVEEDEFMVGKAPELVLPKRRLLESSTLKVSREWADLHVYVLSPWTRSLLNERRSLVSIQGDLVPLCVSRQSRGVRATFGKGGNAVIVDEVLSSPSLLFGQGDSSFMHDDALLASDEYAVRAFMLKGWKALRASTIPSYLYANKEVMTRALDDDQQDKNPCLVLPPNTTTNAKFHWIALEGSEMGEKVQCRSSIIGQNSKLGTKCRLNNVVVMDDVTIGDNCVIQNSIIGAGCVLGEKCSLNDCQVAPNKTVEPMTKEKGESIIDDM